MFSYSLSALLFTFDDCLPLVLVQRYDPTYEATKFHFEDLEKRYDNPIIVLNLIKVWFLIYHSSCNIKLLYWEINVMINWLLLQTVEKRPREMMLRREFTNAVGYLNQILPEENQLRFIHWDFHKFAKR